MDEQMKEALYRALVTAGGSDGIRRGYSALGRKINASRQTVWNMYNKAGRASPQYVIPIEAATEVSRHDLRPDLYPRES